MRLYRALRGRTELAADDLLLERLQLILQAGRHLGVPRCVEGREHRAAVGKRADVSTALERAVSGRQDRSLHRQGDALLYCRDDVLAVCGQAEAAVSVHPHHVDILALAVSGLNGLGRTDAHAAGYRENDVGALADERVGDLLAGAEVREAAGEDALLGLVVPPEHLDVRAVLLVVILHAVPEAIFIDRDGAELLATVGCHLAGLGHARGKVTREE